MDKASAIKMINEFQKKPIDDLKKDVLENASGQNYMDLLKWNAMLDHITIGANTSTTFEYAGIEWTLRLLTAQEYIDCRIAVDEICKELKNFSDYLIGYYNMIKILSIALTPSPFKKEGKTIFSEDDLKLINHDVLEMLYFQYMDFVNLAAKKPTLMSDEEIAGHFEMLKGKPELSMELEPLKLRPILFYAMKYFQALEKTQKSDLNN